MIVKTITDSENGRKWEIIKHETDRYSVKYYEYFKATGWRLTATDNDYTKDCIEWEFEPTVA